MIQKPEFFFVPSSNNTFFGMVGFMFFLFGHEDRRRILSNMNIWGTPWVQAIFPFVLCAVTAIMVNVSFDLRYVKYVITLFFAFWASYLIAVASYRAYGRFDLGILVKYLLMAELIYLGISVMMFFSSSFSTLALSMLKMDAIMLDAVERTSGFRILGFGATFFTSGIMNGFILIILALYMVQNKFSTVKTACLYTLYILIPIFHIGRWVFFWGGGKLYNDSLIYIKRLVRHPVDFDLIGIFGILQRLGVGMHRPIICVPEIEQIASLVIGDTRKERR